MVLAWSAPVCSTRTSSTSPPFLAGEVEKRLLFRKNGPAPRLVQGFVVEPHELREPIHWAPQSTHGDTK